MQIRSAKDLTIYQKAYDLAMRLFELSKSFPKAEQYALTDQIRRSSRSVCANLREGWAKRAYPAHFVSKLTDADGENSETDTWLNFAQSCGYISDPLHTELTGKAAEIGAMLGSMIRRPEKFTQQKHS